MIHLHVYRTYIIPFSFPHSHSTLTIFCSHPTQQPAQMCLRISPSSCPSPSPLINLHLPFPSLALTLTQPDQLPAQMSLRLEPTFEHLHHSLDALGTDFHQPLRWPTLGRLDTVCYPAHTLHPLVRETKLSDGRGEYVSAPFPYVVRDE